MKNVMDGSGDLNLDSKEKIKKINENHSQILKNRVKLILGCKNKKSIIAAEYLIQHYVGNGNILVINQYFDLCKFKVDDTYADKKHPYYVFRQGRELLDQLYKANLIDLTTGKIDIDMTSARELNAWKINEDKKSDLKKQELVTILNDSLSKNLNKDKEEENSIMSEVTTLVDIAIESLDTDFITIPKKSWDKIKNHLNSLNLEIGSLLISKKLNI